MKKLAFLIAIITSSALFSFAGETESNATTYKVDSKASELQWTGYHLAKSYEHTGFITLKSGELTTDGEKLTGGSFIIDMNSISNTDVEDEGKNAKLVNHLKSDEFFGAEEFPEAKLVIKSTEKITPNSYETTADLTIKGITKTITFETIVTNVSDSEITATADITIKRTDFKVMFGWKAENAMLSKNFDLKVNLTAKK